MARALFHPIRAYLLAAAALALVGGCASPNAANIELRKENQQLAADVQRLRSEADMLRAQIGSLQRQGTTVPVLPQERLDRLFTAHGIKINSLTNGRRSAAASDGLRVYLNPVDQNGDELKAAGQYVIEAFDLELPSEQRVGRWTFSADDSRKAWVQFLVRSFVFQCPWQQAPTHGQITLKVTFTDELTGRQFTDQRPITLQGPAPTSTTAVPRR